MTLVLHGPETEAPLGYVEVDVLRLDAGEVVDLGPAPEDVMALAERLLRSQRLITIAHVECTLQLEPHPDGVRVHGHHTFFTNCRNDAPVDFSLVVAGDRLLLRGG